MKNLTNRLTLLALAGLTCMGYTTSSLLSNPNCPTGYTGAPKATSPSIGQVRYCTSCHGDFSMNTAGGGITVTGLPSGTYSAGRAYTFSITINHATANRKVWGFAIKAVNTTDNMVVGSFSSANANASLKGTITGNTAELSHAAAPVTANAAAYTFSNLTWTAPAAPTGKEANIRFYITGNAGDNNGNESGDYIYTKTVDASLSVVPVSLSHFEVTTVKGVSVVASWSTSLEENTALFTLESSTDGHEWTEKGSVAAAGYSGSTQNYSLSDLHPASGNRHELYYRLKMTDADGRITYSGIRKVSFLPGAHWIKLMNANPLKAGTVVQFEMGTESSGPVSVSLYYADGRLCSRKTYRLPAGASTCSLPLPAQSGIYYMRIAQDGWQQTLPCTVE